MENLLDEFRISLKKSGVNKKDRLLLAVSGGLDSVVLATCSSLLELDFAIAHVNFQLRGTESDRDELFVRQLADKLSVPFFVQKSDTAEIAARLKLSIQVTARNLRYDWFEELAADPEHPFHFILTGHHLDDNIETMLMHFFRGTGIAGMTGMPEKNGRLFRPLLRFSRQQLKQFANDRHVEWVEDSSNASIDYTRNYFRNELIPSIEKVFPDLHRNLANNLHRFSETRELFDQAIDRHKKKLLVADGNELHIPILLLKKTQPTFSILYELIKDFHFSPDQTGEVIRLMDGSNGKYISSSTHRIIRNRRWLILAPLNHDTPSQMVIDVNEKEVRYPDGLLRLKMKFLNEPEAVSSDPAVAVLDADKILFPLVLRKWKAGDYFYPLGMKKKKKIARFLIDQKVSKTAKEKIWVLVMDNQIIWVVGQRIDDRFRIKESTRSLLTIARDH